MLFAMLIAAQLATPAETPTKTATSKKTALVRIAVTDISSDGSIEPRVAWLLADSVVAEVRKLERASVISMDEVRAMLAVEANRQAMGCTDDKSCLAEIADALGADVLVSGALATVGEQRVLSLKRIDQKNASVVGSFEERLTKADGEELLAAVGPAIEQLFPDLPLRAGQTRGVAEEKARLLHPPPIPVVATAAVSGLAVVVAGGALVTGLLAASEAAAAQEQVNSSSAAAPLDGAIIVERQDRMNQLGTLSNVMSVGAVVVVVAAGVMVPFTDWTNARAAIAE